MSNTTKAPRLSTTEKRALRFCENLIAYDGGSVVVEWKKSAMYGMNPSINTHGGKCTNISGCGYDKLSACLAECLRYLFPTESEEHRAIHCTSGCGDSSTIAALAKHGWKLAPTFRNKTTDAYQLTRL